jgi:outer membrane protein assembly factor BamB
MKRALALLMLALAVVGCTTIKNIFNDVKKENIEPPTPLTEFPATLQVQKLWDAHVGGGSGQTGERLAPAYGDGKIFVAGIDGTVAALDAATGHALWSKGFGKRGGFIWHHGENSLRWSGGPSVEGSLLVVGAIEGVVQALDAGTGSELWQTQLSSEVIVPPAIADGIVVVRTNDGRLYGLDAANGTKRWTYDRSTVPILSLRGNSTPHIMEGAVYAGEDNGRVLALTLTEGKLIWEQTLTPGEGRTEIERLQDVDGAIAVANGVVYAAGYRGQVAALIAQTGRPLWTHALSSYTGIALAPTQIFVVDTDSVVWSLDLRTGTSNWKQEALKYRWLSETSAMGEYVVFGDIEGFVHWLDGSDGKLAARVQLSKHPILSQPVVVGDTVYIEDTEGVIGAYRIGSAGK